MLQWLAHVEWHISAQDCHPRSASIKVNRLLIAQVRLELIEFDDARTTNAYFCGCVFQCTRTLATTATRQLLMAVLN